MLKYPIINCIKVSGLRGRLARKIITVSSERNVHNKAAAQSNVIIRLGKRLKK